MIIIHASVTFCHIFTFCVSVYNFSLNCTYNRFSPFLQYSVSPWMHRKKTFEYLNLIVTDLLSTKVMRGTATANLFKSIFIKLQEYMKKFSILIRNTYYRNSIIFFNSSSEHGSAGDFSAPIYIFNNRVSRLNDWSHQNRKKQQATNSIYVNVLKKIV